jgi:nicotinamide-nucleotide amidase
MKQEEKLAKQLLGLCIAKKITIATAESCTGGLIAAALTSIAGSSQSFLAGLVCYSNRAKMKVLFVERDLLKSKGAVSPECARAMAEGALAATGASLALSTTGIAGPGGGSAERPVGLVHIAVATEDGTKDIICQFGDIGREQVRIKALLAALELGIERVQ